MRVVRAELSFANDWVAMLHRHHKPVTGHRFSLAAESDGSIVGVAIVGRPVARNTDQINVAEVLRLCTDGSKNACSFLYAAAAKAARCLGFRRVQTFILKSEPGTSLAAAGWTRGHTSSGGDGWQSRRGRRTDQPTEPKVLYYKDLM